MVKTYELDFSRKYGLAQHFQDHSHSFSPYGPPSQQITYIYFFFRGHGNESCNLFGSLPGQYFPISAHGPR